MVVKYFTEMSRYQIAVNPLNSDQNQSSSLELMLYTCLWFFFQGKDERDEIIISLIIT